MAAEVASVAPATRLPYQVAAALGLPEDELELSMGMSGDFEQAVEMGRCACVLFWGGLTLTGFRRSAGRSHCSCLLLRACILPHAPCAAQTSAWDPPFLEQGFTPSELGAYSSFVFSRSIS